MADLNALKRRQQQTWAAGDFSMIATQQLLVGELLCEAVDVHPGQRVLDIATGSELSWLDVTTATTPLAWLAYSGSWVGDHIVAPASAGLAVLHVASRSLEVEQVLSLDHAQFPVGVQEPRFVDGDGNQIAASADIPPAKGGSGVSFLLQCDRITRTCERGEPAPAKDWLRLVDDTGAADEGGH